MRIIILAKAPVPGKVKTRLLTHYTAIQAADLHKQMVRVVLKKAQSVCNDIWFAVDNPNHPFCLACSNQASIKLYGQSDGDLGERLTDLLKQSMATDAQHILFLGTDSPHISPDRYIEAQRQLETYDVVIGAVEDGGYDLIAVKEFVPQIFSGIDWGTKYVLKETLSIINSLGLSVKVLDVSFDLDRPQDLERAPPSSW